MDYNSSVWGHCQDKNGNSLQLRALRYYLGVHNKAPIPGINGEFGWLSTKNRRYLNMCRLWNHLITLDDNRFQKNFKFDLLGVLNINNNLYLNVRQIKPVLQKHAELEWRVSLNSKPKLRTYKQFKLNFNMQNYITFNMSKYQRSLMAQLRLGILPLAIETGRYTNIPVNERYCFSCKHEQKVEDEYHFVYECALYNCI